MVVNITNENYEAEVINSPRPVLLDFGAPWCGPCKKVGKIVHELDDEQDAVKLGYVDIEAYPELAVKHGVVSIPILIFLKDGKIVEKMGGVKSKDKILKLISN